MKIWVNGRLSDNEEGLLSAFDHGFTVGDGVFETCKVVEGEAFALTRHLARLQRSARGLALPDPDEQLVRDGVNTLLAAEPDAGRLRITYTGGPGPLGSERGEAGTTLVLAVSTGGSWEPTTKVSVVPWIRNERSAVAGLKTTSYAENVVALSAAHDAGASEAIFANSRGELCEGTGSNIFVVIDGELLTPELGSGCLAGITRELVVEWSGAREASLGIDALASATEAFLTSSTRDVQPIHAIDDRVLRDTPGPVTMKARDTFTQQSSLSLDP
ncbi:MAG TPA: aminodeoxychorismate lyase [Actinomycetes bacterium]|nr:aminodeoxychorismate lyase [Actinomycetes bacterium]